MPAALRDGCRRLASERLEGSQRTGRGCLLTVPLLSTKLIVPPASCTLVSRPHLLRRLDEGLQPRKVLSLVCAPAGYGKTTLVAEWVKTLTPYPSGGPLGSSTNPVGLATAQVVQTAWLTLDAGDDDLARFLTYLTAALQPLKPGAGNGMLALLQAPRPAPPRVLATLLINDLAEIPGRFAVVLDDYHAVSSQPIHDFLGLLIEHAMAGMRLVIVSRADPPLPLARLRARGQLTELRLADLRFTFDEAARFLSDVAQVELTSEQLATLETRSEGWIAGLQLAALSMRGLEDVSGFIQAFSGGHEHIADYLTEEVLSRQPEAVKAFLLQTSILDRLSGPLCAAVTRQGRAGDTLEKLREENLFLVPLDYQQEWYRYHALFADLLRKRLHQAEGLAVRELHRRASQWYRENGWIGPAVEHALAAQHYAEAANLIEQAAEAALTRGEAATVSRWLEALPAAEKDSRPLLWAFHGLARLLSGQPPGTLKPHVQGIATGAPAQAVQGEIATLQALYAVLDGNTAEAARWSQGALQQLPSGRPFFRCIAADALGMARTLSGDTAAAVTAFRQAVDVAAQAGILMLELLAQSNLAGLLFLRGQLRAAATTYQQVVDSATSRLGKRSPLIGKALLGLGELAREWNDLDGALRYFHAAAEMLGEFVDIGVPIAYLFVARAMSARGDWSGAMEHLEKALQLARESQSTALDDRMADNLQARFWIERGELTLAAEWAQARGLLERPVPQQAAPGELEQSDHATVARLFMAQGRPAQALGILDPLLETSERAGKMRRVIGIQALKALALQECGQTDQALQMLGKALLLAEPEGYVRTFVDEGQPMARLLYLALERGYSPTYASRLLQAFSGEMPQAPEAMRGTAGENLVEPLSQREREVLALIAAGLSNREIAARLHITLSTVKGHTANIYGKLGVTSRIQAVSRARTLGLLADG